MSRTLFEEHVVPLIPELREMAGRLTRRAVEADDLVQVTLEKAWLNSETFVAPESDAAIEPCNDSDASGTRLKSRAWVRRILFNTFVSAYRQRVRELKLFEPTVMVGATAADDGDRYGDEVAQALADLPSEFRSVLVLIDMHDYSYREAADKLGCPIGTVMSRLSRARRLCESSLRTYATSRGYMRAA